MRLITSLIAAAIATLLLLAAPDGAAAQNKYALDKSHSVIGFSIMRFGYSKITGRFADFSGSFSFDEANVANSKVSAKIATASIYSGWPARDKHLRAPSFFNVKEFPEINFTSTKVEKTGAKTGKITGNLNLLGVNKPVTLDVNFNRKAMHPRMQKVFAGFEAKGTIDRTAFGMTFLAPRVAAKVDIVLHILGRQQ